MGGRRGARATHAGELSVNKKGTPLYSREDIREQYCINDKELQVLDKSQRKSLLGCFSNQGQVQKQLFFMFISIMLNNDKLIAMRRYIHKHSIA